MGLAREWGFLNAAQIINKALDKENTRDASKLPIIYYSEIIDKGAERAPKPYVSLQCRNDFGAEIWFYAVSTRQFLEPAKLCGHSLVQQILRVYKISSVQSITYSLPTIIG